MVLVRAEWGESFDYTLVLDTEGICNPLLMGDPQYNAHNNKLATFSVLAPHACILLCNNPEPKLLEVLPMVMTAYNGSYDALKRCGYTTRQCFVVYTRIKSAGAQEALGGNQQDFEEKMHKAWDQVKGAGQVSAFNVRAEDFRYLGFINEPEVYGRQVADLRRHIHESFFSKDDSTATKYTTDLVAWTQLVISISQSIDEAKFDLNFNSIITLQNAKELQVKLSELRRETAEAWKNQSELAEKEIKINLTDRGQRFQTIDDILIKVKPVEDRCTAKVKVLLDEDKYIEFKTQEEYNWKRFLERTKDERCKSLKTFVRNLEHGADVEQKLIKQLCDTLKAEIEKKGLRDPSKVANRRRVFDEIFEAELLKHSMIDSENKLAVTPLVTDQWAKDPSKLPGHEDYFDTRLDADQILREFQDQRLRTKEDLDSRKAADLASRFAAGVTQFIGLSDIPKLEGVYDIVDGCISRIQVAKSEVVTKYDISIVSDALLFVSSWANPKFNAVGRKEKGDFAIKLRNALICILKAKQEAWENKHCLSGKLKTQGREKLLKIFEDMCAGVEGQLLVRNQVVLAIKHAMPEYCKQEAIAVMYTTALSRKWFREPDQVHFLVCLDLIEKLKANPVLAIKCLSSRHASNHYDEVLKKLIFAGYESLKSSLFTRKKEEIILCLKAIKTNILASAGQTKLDLSKYKANHLQTTLPQNLIMALPSDLGILDEAVEVGDWVDLTEDILRQVRAFEAADFQLPDPTFEEMKEKLIKDYGEANGEKVKLRCSAACPECGMTCMYAMEHEGQHDCFHQPSGLSGSSTYETNVLYKYDCVECVRDGHLYVEEVGGQVVKLKIKDEWCNRNKDWKKPALTWPLDLEPVIQLRRFIFKNHQDAIIRYYQHRTLQLCDDFDFNMSLGEIEGLLRHEVRDKDETLGVRRVFPSLRTAPLSLFSIIYCLYLSLAPFPVIRCGSSCMPRRTPHFLLHLQNCLTLFPPPFGLSLLPQA